MEYITDKIGEEYKDWEEGDYIYIKAPTGTGKTHFVFNTLSEYANKTHDKILYLCNRTALKDEVKGNKHSALISRERLTPKQLEQIDLDVRELWQFRAPHQNVYIYTYQKLELIIKNKNRTKDENGDPTDCFKEAYAKLWDYKYIVFDEIQYFLEDSTFNPDTHLSFDFMWQQTEQCKILMSATGDFTKKYGDFLRGFKYPEDHYYIPKDNSYINIVFFKDNRLQGKDYPVELIHDILSTTIDEKIIYFVNRTDRIKKLLNYDVIKRHACCALSIHKRDKELQKINSAQTCIKEYSSDLITFDTRVLITTSALCNGVNIKDRDIKHIICDISNIYTAIQCIGRKRSLDEEDKVTVYIPIQNYSSTQAKRYKNILSLAYQFSNDETRAEVCNNLEYAHIQDCLYTNYVIDSHRTYPTVNLNWARVMYYESQKNIYDKWEQQIDTGLNYNSCYAETFLEIAGMQDCKATIKDISEGTISNKVPNDELLALIDKYKFDNFGRIYSSTNKEIKQQIKDWGITMADFEQLLNQEGCTYKSRHEEKKRYWQLTKK